MAIRFRKSKSLGHGTRLNMSKSGLSVSQRIGPMTVSKRGTSLRILPGLSIFTPRRRKRR
jgi:hypothetical protein